MPDMFSAVQAAADSTNEFNAQQAQINRDWQERMSNTAHQREMADLKAAGLNPILSARQGASTPSGSSASGADASGSIAGLFGQLVSAQSAMAVANANNASARLIEEMRERHDTYIKENFPSNIPAAVAAVVDAFKNPDNSNRERFLDLIDRQSGSPDSLSARVVGALQRFGAAFSRFWNFGTDEERYQNTQKSAQDAYNAWAKTWMKR